MVAVHLMRKYDTLKEGARLRIKLEYGRPDSEVGPFSVVDWIENILINRYWCDLLFVNLVSSMLSIRITIIRGDTLSEVRVRHELELCSTLDMILIYNGNPIRGHYSAAIEVAEPVLKEKSRKYEYYRYSVHSVTAGKGYTLEIDLEERLLTGTLFEYMAKEDKMVREKLVQRFRPLEGRYRFRHCISLV